MVTDAEIASRRSRRGQIWLGIGLFAYVFAFAWSAFGPPLAAAVSTEAAPGGELRPLSDDEAASLRARLRSNDPYRRARSEGRLRDAGAYVDFDRTWNLRAAREPDSAELIDGWVEMRSDQLVGSFRVFFGSDLLASRATSGGAELPSGRAQLRLRVRGGGLGEPLVYGQEAPAGESRHEPLALAQGLSPGRYEVDVVLWAEWTDGTGQARTMEKTATTLSVDRVNAAPPPS